MDNQLKDPIPPPNIDEGFVAELVNVLSKRQGAAWSCLFVAALLDVACTSAEKTLKTSFLNQMTGVNESRPTPEKTPEGDEAHTSLDSLATYSKTVSRVAPFFVKISSRIACVRAIMGGKIVKAVSNAQCDRVKAVSARFANIVIRTLLPNRSSLSGLLGKNQSLTRTAVNTWMRRATSMRSYGALCRYEAQPFLFAFRERHGNTLLKEDFFHYWKGSLVFLTARQKAVRS
jgi:hypothetical protein